MSMATASATSSSYTPYGNTTEDIRSLGRRAGLLYAIPGLTVPFALLYLPKAVFVSGNPTATAERLRSLKWMVELGMAVELINCSMMVLAMIALYRLFRRVSQPLAATMVTLFLISIPLQLASLLNYSAALMLTSGTSTLSAFTQPQLDALAYTFMRLHSRGIVLAQVYWGVWLIPYALVVRRSGFIPAWLGIPLMVAGIAYVLHSVTTLFFPQYAGVVGPVMLALGVGEVPVLVYLIGWGARRDTVTVNGSPSR